MRKKKAMTAAEAKKFAKRFHRAINQLSDARDEVSALREDLESYETSGNDGLFHCEKALEYLNQYL